MNRLLLAGLLAGMSFAAAAQSQPAPSQPQSNAIGTAVQPVVQDEMQSEIPTRDVRDHSCLRETGSLVATAQNQQTLREARRRNDINGTVEVKCAAYGSAYTQQDIRRTGATDLSEALRLLDPSIH